MTDEQSRLENIALNILYAKGTGPAMIRYCGRIFSRHIRGNSILELGPAEGIMTDYLATLGISLTVVDGASAFCNAIQSRHPGIEVRQTLFEDFAPDRQYDNIVLGHVLEHVDEPVDILRRAASWLTPHGKILAAVPNSRSIHRQAAVVMGLLAKEDQLNDMDHHHGHRRVYNPESFRQDFLAAGLTIDIFGGYWLKPLSNGQIEQTWTAEMLEAFMQLGERYPDVAGEIYVVANRT